MRSAILFCLFVVFCVSSAFAAVRPMQASSAASSVSASASAAPSTDADLIHPEHRRQVARLVTTANSLSHSLRAALDTCAAEDRACTIEDFRNLGPRMLSIYIKNDSAIDNECHVYFIQRWPRCATP